MQRSLWLIGPIIIAGALFACVAAPTLNAQSRAPQQVSFPASDAGVVSGALYGSGTRGVVLVHGGRFDRTSWDSQARRIAAAGLRVLAINLRGRGQSRAGSAGADALHLDVLAAVRYLRETGTTSIALVGASIGGWAAAEAVTVAAPNEIQRVVLLAHSPIDQPERLTGRKLFIVSRGDLNSAGAPRLVAIREQYERAPEPKELLIMEGSAHAQFLFNTEEAERLLREILRFLTAP